MDWRDEPQIVESNGQPYRVGWDEHGYFTIQMVEADPTVEDPGPYDYDPVGEYPNTSLPPGVAEHVGKMMLNW